MWSKWRLRGLKAPPLDGEGLGWGGVSGKAATFAQSTPSQPSPIKGEGFLKIAPVLGVLLLAGCGRGDEKASPFPEPHRPVAPISSRYLERGFARQRRRVRDGDPARRGAPFDVGRRYRRGRRLLYGPPLADGRAQGPRARRGYRPGDDPRRSASASSASGSTMSRSGSVSPTIRSSRPPRSTGCS